MDLEQALEELLSKDNDYDTRYFESISDLVADAMIQLDPSKDWSAATRVVLSQEADAGRLSRARIDLDWKDIEARIRAQVSAA